MFSALTNRREPAGPDRSKRARIRGLLGRYSLLGVLAIVAGLVASGCSGGPTQAEFVQRADQVCERTDNAIEKLAPPGQSIEAMGEYAQAVEDLLTKERRSLGDLEPPDDAKASKALFEYVETEIDLIGQIQAAAKRSDAQTVAELFTQSSNELAVSGPRLASSFGFVHCGSGVSGSTTPTTADAEG